MRQQLPSNIDKNTHSTFNRALEHALVTLLKINVLEIETPIKINS